MAERDDGGMPPDVAKELQKESALRENMSRGMYLSDLDRFKQALEGVDAAQTEEEREMARERAYEHFEEIRKQEMGHLEFIADKHMNFEFAFPYDSRQGAVWFMSMRRDLEDTLALDEDHGGFKTDGEARKWVENLYDAVVWGDANYGIQEGLNMISWYYGGLDAMASGLPNMKLRITSTKLADANTVDVRGAGSNKRSAEGLEVRKGKVVAEGKHEVTRMVGKGKDRHEEKKEIPYLIRQKEAVENIRELGVVAQDEFFYWRHIVAGVSQYDYVNPSKEGLLKGSTLRKELEVNFVAQLFGETDDKGKLKVVEYEGKTVPEAIKNFYTMKDTKKNRLEYKHLMMALIECKARERLKECEDGTKADGTLKIKLAKLQSLVIEVRKAKDAIAAREKTKTSTTQDRVRSVAIKQGIVFDIGSANSGPLAWQYEYKWIRNQRDAKGKIIPKSGKLVRRMDFGGINQAGDWYTPEFPFAHNDLYDKTSRLRSKYILPTPDRYRKKNVQEKSPLEKRHYSFEDALKIDPWACMDVLKIIADDDEVIQVGETDAGVAIKMKAGDWREQNKFRLDPEIRMALKDALWFQEIPYPIGTRPDGAPVFPLFPTFMPQRFRLSFLDHIKVKDSSNQTVTLGDRLRNGEILLSEVDYDNDLKEHQWDRWLVNMNMGERLLRFVAEPGDPRAAEAILAGPATYKEGTKRVGLHTRDSYYEYYIVKDGKRVRKTAPPVFFEIAMLGQMHMLASIKANERGGGLSHDLISQHIETSDLQDAWENQLAEYINSAKYLTPDTGEDEGVPEFYNEGLALVMAVTGNSLYRIALEGGTNVVHDRIKVKGQLKTMMISRKKLVKRNKENLKA